MVPDCDIVGRREADANNVSSAEPQALYVARSVCVCVCHSLVVSEHLSTRAICGARGIVCVSPAEEDVALEDIELASVVLLARIDGDDAALFYPSKGIRTVMPCNEYRRGSATKKKQQDTNIRIGVVRVALGAQVVDGALVAEMGPIARVGDLGKGGIVDRGNVDEPAVYGRDGGYGHGGEEGECGCESGGDVY